MVQNPFNLSGRLILVTGATSGIGLATVKLLTDLGARLILVGRTRERLEAVTAESAGANHIVAPFDITNTEEIANWMKGLATQHGPLNAVVHSAGVQLIRPLRLVSALEIASVMNINLTAAIMLAKGLRQKGAHTELSSIVFVSSVMGLVGATARTAYCASKGALAAVTKSLALELASEGVRVNCVAPGMVNTPMLTAATAVVGDSQMQAIVKMHPLGLGEPLDVANAIAFLLADTARWITGTTLVVDGGYTAQ